MFLIAGHFKPTRKRSSRIRTVRPTPGMQSAVLLSDDLGRKQSERGVKSPRKHRSHVSSDSEDSSAMLRKKTKRDHKKKKKDKKSEKKARHRNPQRKSHSPSSSTARRRAAASDEPSEGSIPQPSACDHPEDRPSLRPSMTPMSKQQYDAEQAVVREVLDPETNRLRLIRGSGEVIERIISRQEHAHINAAATRGDGVAFFAGAISMARRKP